MRLHPFTFELIVLVTLTVVVILATATAASASQNVEAIYKFQGVTDGFSPQGLIAKAKGDLFGTTYAGGDSKTCFQDCGTVYRLTPAAPGPQWKNKKPSAGGRCTM
jgi:uncharacterized repeat protein (TIGR03803 family)